MTLDRQRAQALLEKLSELPAERLAEVEDFVDFLRQRQHRLEQEEAQDAQAVCEIESRIASGEERVSDWADFAAELDGLPAQDH